MILYHFDLRPNIEAIVREGFRDGDIWLSDISLLDDADPPLGPDFAQVIVDAPDVELEGYEVVDNPRVRAGNHREWRVPAALVNRWSRRLADKSL